MAVLTVFMNIGSMAGSDAAPPGKSGVLSRTVNDQSEGGGEDDGANSEECQGASQAVMRNGDAYRCAPWRGYLSPRRSHAVVPVAVGFAGDDAGRIRAGVNHPGRTEIRLA